MKHRGTSKKLSSWDKDIIINDGMLGKKPERAWVEFLSIMADSASDLLYDVQGQITNDAEPTKLPDSPNIRLAQTYIGLETEQVPRSKRKLHAAMRKNCVGRRLFTSKLGTVGLVPGNAKAGDSIAIFHGVDFPYVVRKTVDSKFVIVGDSWLPVYTRRSAASNNNEAIRVI